MTSKLPVIAAFDFDGTLTYRDTLTPFFIYSRGFARLAWATIRHLPSLFGYVTGAVARKKIKEIYITALFKGIPLEQLRTWGDEFAAAYFEKCIKPEALERLRWHQSKGHTCLLVSANLDVQLDAWAKKLAFEKTICCNIAADAKGNATGLIAGENCWGPEKRNRLEKLLGPKKGYLLYAYGDTRGDHEMLELADYPFYNKFS